MGYYAQRLFTLRFEYAHRNSNVPYFAGPGGGTTLLVVLPILLICMGAGLTQK